MRATRTVTETRAYARPDSRSAALWARAQEVMPGGNSRTTVFMAPRPIYAAEGDGCWIVDVDGDRRLDLINNYTSLIHGHAHPALTAAAQERLVRGTAFPLPTAEEIDMPRNTLYRTLERLKMEDFVKEQQANLRDEDDE